MAQSEMTDSLAQIEIPLAYPFPGHALAFADLDALKKRSPDGYRQFMALVRARVAYTEAPRDRKVELIRQYRDALRAFVGKYSVGSLGRSPELNSSDVWGSTVRFSAECKFPRTTWNFGGKPAAR